MPKESSENGGSSFDFFSNIFQYNLRKIDSSVYKKVGLFFIIAVFLAVVVYAALRINQEISVSQKTDVIKKDNSQSEQLKKETQVAGFDQQRKNDVFIINSALKAYFLDKEESPAVLDQLTPEFIEEIPKDPEGSNNYTYEPSADKKNWSLSTILSDGSVFKLNGP